MKKILIFISLFGFLFFGEIAMTFSDKGYPSLLNDEEVPFSLLLDNSYSDLEETKSIDRQVEAFIKRWKIEGASLAVTKDERLVYAKGFGTANTETGEEVKPGHLFRIASVSKLITAVAIMKLYEEGHLDLNDPVFGERGILNDSLFWNYADPRVEEITVRHLLNHTAGWSRYAGDPLFNPLYIARKMGVPAPASLDHILQYTLKRDLNYKPGTRYSYSNLGYAILGKVIEQKSGMPYQDYVVMNLLKPLGIHDMHIGKSYYHEKYPNEVRYHHSAGEMTIRSMDGTGEIVPIYYGGNDMELLGPAGGWVASAPELAKFMTAIDGFDEQPDILSRETIISMSNPNTAGKGLFGWRGSDRYGTWWRTGYLSGSSALIVRQNDGINWVVMTNTSTYKQSRIHRYVSGMMFGTVGKVQQWPVQDLFTMEENHPGPISDIPATNPKL
ncbi:MAG: serine hydrolase domain-containing protein [Bacteroidota bacterium]|nr:serine hydrolase domain-containing protein [Bacteroidota bacterium]